MYLPENNAQLYEILSALRLYAATNALPSLAESLDDAIHLLIAEASTRRTAAVPHTFGIDQA